LGRSKLLTCCLSEVLIMLNRPPPYFPQNQLSPPDEKRYAKFKLVIAGIIIGLLVVLLGLVAGVYFLIRWLA